MSNSNLSSDSTNLIVVQSRQDGNSAEIAVKAFSGGFSGHGSAWFEIQDLTRKIEHFEEFPINENSLPKIAGGVWNEDGTELIQEHVCISARMANTRGTLILTVKLFSPHAQNFGGHSGRKVEVDYFINYEELRRFSTQIRSLIAGETSVITFGDFITS